MVLAALAVGCSDASDPTPESVSSTTSLVDEGPPGTEMSGRWESAREPGVGGRITDVSFQPGTCDVILAGGDLLGAVRSEDGGETWQQIEGLTGREVSRFTWDRENPEVVWIATMSGPFRSDDGGRSVVPARTGMSAPSEFTYSAPIETVLEDPARDGRLLAFGGSHRRWNANPGAAWGTVWESVDDGATWQDIGAVADGVILGAAHTGSGWIVSVDEVGVFFSPDGRDWDGPVQDLGGRTVSQFLDVGGTLWASITSDTSEGGLASSSDGGVSWTLDDEGIERTGDAGAGFSTSFESLATDSTGSVVYAGDVGFGSASVSARTSGSPSWERRSSTADLPATPYSSGLIAKALAVSPCDSEHVVVGTDETLWSSRDGAATWDDISSSPAGTDSWVGRGYGGLVSTGADHLGDGTLVTSALDGGNLLLRRPDGTWYRPLGEERPFGGGYDVDARGDSAVVALGQFGTLDAVAVTTDSGSTWTTSELGQIDGFPTYGELPVSVAVAPDGSWLLAASGGLWRSDGADLQWTRVDVGAEVHDVVASENMVVLATGSGVMVTDSVARELIPIAGPTSPVGDVRLTVTDDDTILAAVWREGDVGVWRLGSTTGASGWQNLNDNPQARSVAVDPTDPRHLVVALEDHPFHDATYRVGVIESFDGGDTWMDHGDGLPLERVSVVVADPARAGHWIVGTHGSGWWESFAPDDGGAADENDDVSAADGGPDGE